MNVNSRTTPEIDTPNREKVANSTPASGNSTCSKPWSFVDLPDDVLFAILSFCDKKTLGRVCCTCLRLRELASKDCVWTRESKNYTIMVCPGLNSKHSYSSDKERSQRRRVKSLKERCRIAKNWETKNFKDVPVIKHKTKLIPWIRLHRQWLYVSNAMNINCYNIFNDGTVREDQTKRISMCDSDVTRFVVSDEVIVSGFRGGGILGYDVRTCSKKFEYDFSECGDTQAVDVYNHIVVAGFRDGSVKVINTREDSGITDLDNVVTSSRFPNRIWSVSTASDGSTFTVGNAGHEISRTPIEVYDLTSCRLLYSLGAGCKRGAGVLDIKYESPHTVLTCGYDTSLRLWDLRTQTCVKEWEEPFDTELSSLQSDGNNVIVTGTFQYGMTRLWDKRLKDPVQMYYCGHKRSPVYCLDTDFQRLFVALDVEIHMLDFSIYSTPGRK